MIGWILFGVSAVLTVFGIFCFACAQFGLQSRRFTLPRMHAAAVGDTLGFISILAAVCISEGLSVSTLKLILLAVIWLFSSPTSGHLLAQIVAVTSGLTALPDEKEDEK